MMRKDAVFLSTSSSDLWIAQRISEDLQKIGCDAFLYARSVATGQSITPAIRRAMHKADYVILLLSAHSVNSPWVMTEIGAAWALNKRVLPILIGLSPDSLPTVLRDCRARDINEIAEVYREIQASRRGRSPFAVGDIVTIPETPRRPVPRDGDVEEITWIRAQDQYCGKQARVTRIGDDGIDAVEIDLDNGRHYWAYEWLTSPSRRGGRKSA